jgi:hypothetical protein
VPNQRTTEKLRQKIRAELQPGEQVVNDVIGRMSGELLSDDLILALTDRRVIAHIQSPLTRKTLSWPFDNITAVGTGKGVVRGQLVFSVPGDQFVATSIPKAEAEDFRRAVEARLSASRFSSLPPPPPPQPTGSDAGPADRLRRLEDLMNQGLISKDEYDMRRTNILDSI